MLGASVVLPFRDVGPLLGEALASVLADPGCAELIAIDDGSRDGGGELVASFARRDPRVVPLKTTGVGIVGALRVGLAHARSPFIARMDGDDVSHPPRIASALAALDADPTLGVVGSRVDVTPAGSSPGLARYVAWQNALSDKHDHARERFVESPLCHPSVVMRRAALDSVGGYEDPVWPEDYDLWLRMARAGWGLAKTSLVGLSWRHREGRLTFLDPRYSAERIVDARAHYLRAFLPEERELLVWGAGRTGKRLARALAPREPAAFIDIDPRKLGSVARGQPILTLAEATARIERGAYVLAAVGARGAREIIRPQLEALGLREASFRDAGDFCFGA
ncbi:MAG: glycosyltransferase [Polyangiaceae bacterium]